jgi:hypothetical protein
MDSARAKAIYADAKRYYRDGNYRKALESIDTLLFTFSNEPRLLSARKKCLDALQKQAYPDVAVPTGNSEPHSLPYQKKGVYSQGGSSVKHVCSFCGRTYTGTVSSQNICPECERAGWSWPEGRTVDQPGLEPQPSVRRQTEASAPSAPPLFGKETIGCPICLGRFSIKAKRFGSKHQCPHCSSMLDLPTFEAFDKARSESGPATWTVISRRDNTRHSFTGLADVRAKMLSQTFGPDDLCVQHSFAPAKPLRKITDEIPELQELYAPAEVRSQRVARAWAAVTFIGWSLLALVVSVAGACLNLMGPEFSPLLVTVLVVGVVAVAYAILLLGRAGRVLGWGMLGVASIVVPAFLTQATGVQVGPGVMLAIPLALFLIGLSGLVAGAIAFAVAYMVMRLVCTMSRVHANRLVKW